MKSHGFLAALCGAPSCKLLPPHEFPLRLLCHVILPVVRTDTHAYIHSYIVCVCIRLYHILAIAAAAQLSDSESEVSPNAPSLSAPYLCVDYWPTYQAKFTDPEMLQSNSIAQRFQTDSLVTYLGKHSIDSFSCRCHLNALCLAVEKATQGGDCDCDSPQTALEADNALKFTGQRRKAE